ncbi:PepSY-associated TM helix domain-containing protein [Novosphingopyxis sp.]|uniref:PepSY-associated TM helix domain-containing protein n=1 Tax=Novosphingopyxis sp. TaxID=2709690 RepID=UPI003B5C5EEB
MAGDLITGENGMRLENWYRTVWRWHFYAGLFTVPFILWLSITGCVYLFKPQIEALIDRPYDGLAMDGPAAPSVLARAAQAAVPGSVLHRYILPEHANDARRVVVGVGAKETRVYLHPQTGKVLKTVGEEDRLMRIVFRLHGELMAGRWGSTLVELAASWAIIMLLTGLFLWWPRGAGLAGALYPRLRRTGRKFWRDIHAVTGVWVSLLAIFLILSGLPWAKNWGDYLGAVREMTGTALAAPDWPQGTQAEARARKKLDAGAREMIAEHSEHGGMVMAHAGPLSALDRLVPKAETLGLAAPVEISPPTDGSNIWLVKSNAANRPLRATVRVDGDSGMIVSRENFDQRHWIDRLVGYGIAIHEGAFLGLLNQLISLATILALMSLAISSIILWWRRRPDRRLGAPPPRGAMRHSWLLVVLTVALGFLVPLFGVSLAIVTLLELAFLQRSPRISALLGLRRKSP